MNFNANPFRDMSVRVLATPSANRAMVGTLQVTKLDLSSIIHTTPGTIFGTAARGSAPRARGARARGRTAARVTATRARGAAARARGTAARGTATRARGAARAQEVLQLDELPLELVA